MFLVFSVVFFFDSRTYVLADYCCTYDCSGTCSYNISIHSWMCPAGCNPAPSTTCEDTGCYGCQVWNSSSCSCEGSCPTTAPDPTAVPTTSCSTSCDTGSVCSGGDVYNGCGNWCGTGTKDCGTPCDTTCHTELVCNGGSVYNGCSNMCGIGTKNCTTPQPTNPCNDPYYAEINLDQCSTVTACTSGSGCPAANTLCPGQTTSNDACGDACAGTKDCSAPAATPGGTGTTPAATATPGGAGYCGDGRCERSVEFACNYDGSNQASCCWTDCGVTSRPGYASCGAYTCPANTQKAGAPFNTYCSPDCTSAGRSCYDSLNCGTNTACTSDASCPQTANCGTEAPADCGVVRCHVAGGDCWSDCAACTGTTTDCGSISCGACSNSTVTCHDNCSTWQTGQTCACSDLSAPTGLAVNLSCAAMISGANTVNLSWNAVPAAGYYVLNIIKQYSGRVLADCQDPGDHCVAQVLFNSYEGFTPVTGVTYSWKVYARQQNCANTGTAAVGPNFTGAPQSVCSLSIPYSQIIGAPASLPVTVNNVPPQAGRVDISAWTVPKDGLGVLNSNPAAAGTESCDTLTNFGLASCLYGGRADQRWYAQSSLSGNTRLGNVNMSLHPTWTPAQDNRVALSVELNCGGGRYVCGPQYITRSEKSAYVYTRNIDNILSTSFPSVQSIKIGITGNVGLSPGRDKVKVYLEKVDGETLAGAISYSLPDATSHTANNITTQTTDQLADLISSTTSTSPILAGEIEMQALDMTRQNFVLDTWPACLASGIVPHVFSDRPTGSLTKTFGGPDGLYYVKVVYFDESDGVSSMALKVDGVTKFNWTMNLNTGGDIACAPNNANLFQQFGATPLQLTSGSVISLASTFDPAEYMRIAKLVFIPVVNEVVNKYEFSAGGCDSVNGADCSSSLVIPPGGLPAGQYAVHVEMPAEYGAESANVKCSGNPFCSYETTLATVTPASGLPVPSYTCSNLVSCSSSDNKLITVFDSVVPTFADFSVYTVDNTLSGAGGYKTGTLMAPQNTDLGFSGNQICQTSFQNSANPRSVGFRVGIVDNSLTSLSEVQMRLNYAGGNVLSLGLSGIENPATMKYTMDPVPVGTSFYEPPHVISVGTSETRVIFPVNFATDFELDPLNYNMQVWAKNIYGQTMVGEWYDTQRTFKTWDCQVNITGNLYDATGASGQGDCSDATSWSTFYSVSGDRNNDLISLNYRNATSLADNIVVGINRSADGFPFSITLPWGNTYLPIMTTQNMVSPLVGWVKYVDPVDNTKVKCVSAGDNLKFLGNQPAPDIYGNTIFNPYRDPGSRGHAMDVKYTTVNFDGWFQVKGSGADAKISVLDKIPLACEAPGCVPALSIASGAGRLDDGLISNTVNSQTFVHSATVDGLSRLWKAQTQKSLIKPGTTYLSLYNDFYVKRGIGVTEIPGGLFDDNGFINLPDQGVVFVPNDVIIDSNYSPGVDKFIMLVVQGDITISDKVTSLSGVYFAGGNINIGGTNTLPLTIKGVVRANGDVTTSRSVMNGVVKDNGDNPAVIFEYDPGLMFNTPKELNSSLGVWLETAQ